MGVFRFSNAVSDISKFIDTYKTLYKELKGKKYFDHDDARDALIKHSLVSSSGAIGEEAVKRSVREDRSRDPLYNQLKMYSEVFRMLGWYRPAISKTTFNFTELGYYISTSDEELVKSIFKFTFYSIVTPNNLVKNNFGNICRPIKCILDIGEQADKQISRDEIITHIFTIENDLDMEEDLILANINKDRFEKSKLRNTMNSLVSDVEIQKTTLENYTRFPIAGCKYCEWFTEMRVKTNDRMHSLKYFGITDEAIEYNNHFKNKLDLRYAMIEHFSQDEKSAFTYLMFLKNLDFIGYNIDEEAKLLIDKLEILSKKIFESLGINNADDIHYSSIQQSTTRDFQCIDNLEI